MKLLEVHFVEENSIVSVIMNSDVTSTLEIKVFIIMVMMTDTNFGGAQHCKIDMFS